MTDQPDRDDDQFADLPVTDVSPYPAYDQQEFLQRVLRTQLGEKFDEIQQDLGLTDLAMLEVVTHWMKHKIRDLRDAEVEALADEEDGPVSRGGYPVGP
jgi:hypothetical protein